LTGNSTGHSPSGIRGTGPFVGPPELNRSLGGCGVGDAEALLGGDALLLRAGLLRGGVLVGGLLAGGVLVGGLLVGGGVGTVVEGGLLVGGGEVMVVVGGPLAGGLPDAGALPVPISTGVSSLAGSS
jgi:hypothetical protein